MAKPGNKVEANSITKRFKEYDVVGLEAMRLSSGPLMNPKSTTSSIWKQLDYLPAPS